MGYIIEYFSKISNSDLLKYTDYASNICDARKVACSVLPHSNGVVEIWNEKMTDLVGQVDYHKGFRWTTWGWKKTSQRVSLKQMPYRLIDSKTGKLISKK